MKAKNETTTIAEQPLTPAELIKKHNANPKHVITENEMMSLKIGSDAEDSQELNRQVDEKESEDDCRHHENNTYDILDA